MYNLWDLTNCTRYASYMKHLKCREPNILFCGCYLLADVKVVK